MRKQMVINRQAVRAYARSMGARQISPAYLDSLDAVTRRAIRRHVNGTMYRLDEAKDRDPLGIKITEGSLTMYQVVVLQELGRTETTDLTHAREIATIMATKEKVAAWLMADGVLVEKIDGAAAAAPAKRRGKAGRPKGAKDRKPRGRKLVGGGIEPPQKEKTADGTL